MFKIIKKDRSTKARLGFLKTAHGTIKTPSYVIVATHAQIKCLKPSDIKKTKTQVVICNTFHLWDKLSTRPLLKKLGVTLPTMTDSGGFQVFSLSFGDKNKIGKILNPVDKRLAKSFIHRRNVRITSKGAYFRQNGKIRFLGPELSIKLQEKLGADITFAFDECTSPLDSFNYNKKSLERTHRWAKQCLDVKTKKDQLLFGIVQGGRFKLLRVKSAKFIGSLPFDGFGIGGSFGKEEMDKMLKWVIPYLPEEKPRHLLGVGRIDDIFRAVENGVDLFDCVIPTREARHGRIWAAKGHYDILKLKYANKKSPLEAGCKCETCKKITKAKLHELFKSNQPIRQAQGKRWATIHNIWFFNNLLENIRRSIKNKKFQTYKNRFLERFKP